MTIKEQLYIQCKLILDTKLNTIRTNIQELQESLTSETKSSAGDKHETGRAMVQLEREKIGNQLAEIQKTKTQLEKINVQKTQAKIALGSVVYTTKFNYYIAISAGEIIIDGNPFFAISPLTPIAKLLLSKTVGDTISFRALTFTITKVD